MKNTHLSKAIVVGLLAVGMWLAPAPARAGFTLAGSVGSGWRVNPDSGRVPTSLMLAPGIELMGSFLRFELGLAADLPDVSDSSFDITLRPMLVLQPLPFLYGRLTAGATQLVHGPVAFAFGGALGLTGHVAHDVSLFAEAGFVPRVNGDSFTSVFEGRVGMGVGF